MVEDKDQPKDKYKKVKKLGTGTYGSAYLVQSKINHKLWVIKKVDLNDMMYEERVKAKEEARILEVLNHPNIITFRDAFKDKKLHLNLVMEFADGGELADLIRETRRAGNSFTEDEILNFFTQICLALKHCHDRKILHRDLKTNNVFLTRRGICKLGDFGISCVLRGTRSKARSIVGTPLYLSPEILNVQPYNQKTDIWSLGIILYEMAALRPPWQEQDLIKLGRRICLSKHPPIPEHYSFALKNIINLCLQKNPSQRPTIHSLLNMPVIQKRIRNYLQEEFFKEEFAHTLLHSQNVFDEFKKNKLARMAESGGNATVADEGGDTNNPATQSTQEGPGSLFHPPQSYVEEGGQEDFYVHEMQALIKEVVRGEDADEQQVEIEADGIDLTQIEECINENSSSANDDSYLSNSNSHDVEKLAQVTSDWAQFEPYMQEIYGAEVFSQGYDIVRQNREQAFTQEGMQVLIEQLSPLFQNDALSQDFIRICLMQMIAEPMQNGAFVTNLSDEAIANLPAEDVEDI